jgi:hypothetical protein
MEMNGQHHVPDDLSPATHSLGDWVESRAGVDAVGKSKMSSFPEIEPKFLGRPDRGLVTKSTEQFAMSPKDHWFLATFCKAP